MTVASDPQIREIIQGLARAGRRHLPGPNEAAEHMQDFEVGQPWRVECCTLPTDDSRDYLAGRGR